MSLRNHIFLLFSLSALAVFTACGGGSGSPVIPTPPPTGGFSNSNFNGTYTFSISGANANGLFAMAGSFTACGCSGGTISAGTVDIADPTGAQPHLALITPTSVYSVSTDGRGIAKLFFNTAATPNYEMDLDFVLTSSSHGLIIRYDQNGTGSGTIDLQDSSVSQSQLANQFYAYSISGGDFSNASLAGVGVFQLDATGTINGTTSIADFSYAKNPSANLPLTGSLVLGSATTPGSASLSTTFSSTPLGFDVFAIDSSHFKLIETDNQSILVGDALLSPSNAFPSGNLVFTMAGLDSTSNFFASGGVVTSDGAAALTNGLQDVNDGGVVDGGGTTPTSFTGTMIEQPNGSGRWIVALNGFFGGINFVAYPSNGGLLMLESDSGLGAGVTGGIALQQQSGVTDLATQGYGLNLTGEDLVNATEADLIAEFKASSGSLSGTLDSNDGGSLTTQSLTGTYSATNGLGSATLNAGFAGMFYYVVDNSTALFISVDSGLPGLGSMEVQTTPSNAASKSTQAPHVLPSFRVIPHGKSALNRHRTTTLGKK
jgi:hypothetical protein